MKKFVYAFILLLFILPLSAQQTLTEEAEVSILVCGSSHDAAFTLYGHAAIRINDPLQDLDVIFNYGMFDFSAPNFIYRFAKGETDYRLGINNFLDYVIEYQMRGSSVTELVLNLTQEEKNNIWNALLINYQPENRVYRYNFFFDNCASRLVSIVEKNINGEIVYHTEQSPRQTFRDLINYCTREHAWLTFGCDLALGSPTDRIATPHEKMFLPEYLESFFIEAAIRQPDGHVKKLVKETTSYSEFDPEINSYSQEIITPMLSALLLMLVVWILTYLDWRRKNNGRVLDCILFSIAGIGGCVLFFIACLSVHPCVFPNWSLLWLHPLHLVGAVLFSVKKFNVAANYYHFINFAILTLLLAGWYFIPQHMNVAFIPLILTLWIRSAYATYKAKK